MSDPVFEHRHRVAYAECTVGNHVYYSRYLDILEEARGEMFRQAGCPLLGLQESGVAFPVIAVQMSYKAPARYDDLLIIQLWMTEMRGIRLTVGFRILNSNGTVLVEGETRHVCAGLDEKPKRLPEGMIQMMEKYVRPRGGVEP